MISVESSTLLNHLEDSPFLKPNLKNNKRFYTFMLQKFQNIAKVSDNTFEIKELDVHKNIPSELRNIDEKRILQHILTTAKRHILVISENIHLHLIFETSRVYKVKDKMQMVLLLFGLLKQFTKLPNDMHVYVYLTSLKKKFSNSKKPLGFYQVNTGFTYTNYNKIVLFRQQEWFKVLIHESFHCLGLDFSSIRKKDWLLHTLFHGIQSEMLAFEGYCEFWAITLNTMIYAFTYHPNTFQKTFVQLLQKEQHFRIYQMVKVLKSMGLSYNDIINGQNVHLFKEDTNVFAYYVLGSILLNHFDEFVEWCYQNNAPNNIFQCRATEAYLRSFSNFIKASYKKKLFLQNVETLSQTNHSSNRFMKTSLRLSSLEFI
jgi:hypothetical protein